MCESALSTTEHDRGVVKGIATDRCLVINLETSQSFLIGHMALAPVIIWIIVS